MVDKVRPLKLESTAIGGSQDDLEPTATNPAQDYIAAKGMAYENSDSYLSQKHATLNRIEHFSPDGQISVHTADTNRFIEVADTVGGTDCNTTGGAAITFNSEVIKDAGFTHSNSISNSMVTLARAGLYKISYSISWNNTGGFLTGTRNIKTFARINGSTAIANSNSFSESNGTNNGDSTNKKTFFYTNSNTSNYLEIVAIRDGGGGTAPTIANASNLVIEFLRP